MNLKKKIGKLFTSRFGGTGPSSYEKRIYRVAVSQSLRNTSVKDITELQLWSSQYGITIPIQFTLNKKQFFQNTENSTLRHLIKIRVQVN